MENAIEKDCWMVARRATFMFVAIIFLFTLQFNFNEKRVLKIRV
ncbi:hypothetical protein [Bartonella sp. 114]|nr:hypothetical protein [Bartonella sp. 114]AQX23975.1 hypothetical protein Bho114_006470 [Bartonella sp. 114]